MCPECNSVQFRRSQRQGTGERLYSWLKPGLSPYRCENCANRFWLSKKVADQAVVEAIATETANVIQMEPLSFNTSDKGFRKSQFQNQPKFRLRRWVWCRTKLEVEAAFMLLLLGTGVLAAVWVAIDQI